MSTRQEIGELKSRQAEIVKIHEARNEEMQVEVEIPKGFRVEGRVVGLSGTLTLTLPCPYPYHYP